VERKGTTGRREAVKIRTGFLKNLGPDVPHHFTAFHPDFKVLDISASPPETPVRARKQALAAGLRHVYVGNIHDLENDSTYCGSCGQVLIERDWYELGRYNLDEPWPLYILRCATAKSLRGNARKVGTASVAGFHPALRRDLSENWRRKQSTLNIWLNGTKAIILHLEV
jgi:hypothetical protein